MINTLLLYDNQDATLGTFFNLCANKFLLLNNAISQKSVCTEHNTENCKKETIESVLSDYNSSKFLFVSFLHGNEDAMYVSNAKIVSFDNAYFFSNAFCYTFSCYCGKKLAHILLENRALVFWGYIDKAYTVADYEDDFADLSVSGLKHFLSNETVESAYNKVKEEFTIRIDSLYQDNFFVAATLLHNRDSMVVYGNKSLTVSDFIISDK
jgi:hypothetical protein